MMEEGTKEREGGWLGNVEGGGGGGGGGEAAGAEEVEERGGKTLKISMKSE